jgi:prophage regulatory protein
MGILMLPAQGSTAMRLLSKRQLKEIVLHSPQHIQRVKNANPFPKRVRLRYGPRSGVGWIESGIMDWIQKRIAAREKPTDISE